jgi:hypothetical protein
MSFVLYAIRHKPTGAYLPMRWESRRGYSHDEPTPGAVPRLFKNEKAAKAALKAWLQGTWERSISQSYDGDYDEVLSTTPQPSRHEDEMEIVELGLADDAAWKDAGDEDSGASVSPPAINEDRD